MIFFEVDDASRNNDFAVAVDLILVVIMVLVVVIDLLNLIAVVNSNDVHHIHLVCQFLTVTGRLRTYICVSLVFYLFLLSQKLFCYNLHVFHEGTILSVDLFVMLRLTTYRPLLGSRRSF